MRTELLNRIVLHRIPMNAHIGVYAWEKEIPQPIVVDVEFDLPGSGACITDELTDTVDYAAVVALLKDVAITKPHRLVEAMAETMCHALHERFGLHHIRLTLLKLAPFPGSEVGIVVERVWAKETARALTPARRVEESA
jgi:dihydroneopterin aldolase